MSIWVNLKFAIILYLCVFKNIHNNNFKIFNTYLSKKGNHILMQISFCPKIAHQKNSWWHLYEIPFNTSPYTLKEKNMMDLFTQNADKKIYCGVKYFTSNSEGTLLKEKQKHCIIRIVVSA